MAVRILHIIKSLGRGGAETLLPETLSKHDKHKYEFHYIYFLPWKDQMVAEIEKEGGLVTCFPSKNNFAILMKTIQLVRYIRRNKIQLIHCHLPWAGIVGRLVGKISGVRVIYTEHNTWDHYHKLTFYLNKLSFPNQHKVIAVSRDVANSIKTHYRRKRPEVQIVSNGINTDKFSVTSAFARDIRKELGIAPDRIVIGTACVFRAQKRLSVWLEIAAAIHERFPNCVFMIIGDGTLREQIRQKAELLGMKEYLHFTGLQPEIRPYLRAINIFMMCSEFEGLPIALLEAMSMRCMPACTAAGGIPELIIDGENGILAPVSDPMQLVTRLSPYLLNPSNISKAGEIARQTVLAKFDMQKMVKELEGIYENTLN